MDKLNLDLKREIEDEAISISLALPDFPYADVKQKLELFGNMPHRMEAVLRDTISTKYRILRSELSPMMGRKRYPQCDNASNQPDEDTIRIKIRRKDGELSVVSSIDQRNSSMNASQHNNIELEYSSTAPAGTVAEPNYLPSSSTSCTSAFDTESVASNSSSDTITSAEESRQQKLINLYRHHTIPTSSQYMPMQRRIGNPAKAVAPSANNNNVSTPANRSEFVNEWLDDVQRNPLHARTRVSKRIKKPSATITSRDVAPAIPEIDITSPVQVENASQTPVQPEIGPRELKKQKTSHIPVAIVAKPHSVDVFQPKKKLGKRGYERLEFEKIVMGSLIKESTIPALNHLDVARLLQAPIPSGNHVDIAGPLPPTIPSGNHLDVAGALQAAIPASNNLDVAGSSQSAIPPGDHFFVAGPSHEASPPRNFDTRLVYKIYEIFPDACPRYVKKLCDNMVYSEDALDQVIGQLLSSENYPRRENRAPTPEPQVDVDTQLENLRSIFPNADPTYLRQKCEEFVNDMDQINQFIMENLQSPKYPTMKEFLRKQQLSAQQRQYTTNFKVEDFVKLFPNPQETFENKKRKIVLDDESTQYLSMHLRNIYPLLHVRTVQTVVYNFVSVKQCIQLLQEKLDRGVRMKSRRKPVSLEDVVIQNIPLLQDLAYHLHRTEILKYIEMKKAQEEEEKQIAITNGLIESCGCCFDEEILPKDVFTCSNGCKFCRDCIKRNAEVAMGEGKCKILCMNNCDSQFNLQVLQSVLPPNMFTKLAQQNMLEEVKAAGIEDLEYCPSCDFASIPAPDDKLFRCMNPVCMKETCRECREPSHVPLRCEEVEKDKETKARTYIENKMTDALLRTCYRCQARFFKEEGCNKMTCSCGAHMCYICNQPVTDYKHFNGIGGDEIHKCPLYSDNIELNQQNVLRAADTAKKEVDQVNLKHDPSKDVTAHYQERKKVVQQPHLIAIQEHQRHRQHGDNQNRLGVQIQFRQ